MASSLSKEFQYFLKDYQKYKNKSPVPLLTGIEYANMIIKKELSGKRVGKKIVAASKKILTDANFAIPTMMPTDQPNVTPKKRGRPKLSSVEKFKKSIPSGFAGDKTINETISYVLEKSNMFPKKVVDLAEKAYNDTRFSNVVNLAKNNNYV